MGVGASVRTCLWLGILVQVCESKRVGARVGVYKSVCLGDGVGVTDLLCHQL